MQAQCSTPGHWRSARLPYRASSTCAGAPLAHPMAQNGAHWRTLSIVKKQAGYKPPTQGWPLAAPKPGYPGLTMLMHLPQHPITLGIPHTPSLQPS